MEQFVKDQSFLTKASRRLDTQTIKSIYESLTQIASEETPEYQLSKKKRLAQTLFYWV